MKVIAIGYFDLFRLVIVILLALIWVGWVIWVVTLPWQYRDGAPYLPGKSTDEEPET